MTRLTALALLLALFFPLSSLFNCDLAELTYSDCASFSESGEERSDNNPQLCWDHHSSDDIELVTYSHDVSLSVTLRVPPDLISGLPEIPLLLLEPPELS